MSNRRRADELTASEEDASVKRLLEQTNTALEVPENRRRLMCLSMFWHFLDVVWIGVFTFVYLMGVLP